MEIELWDKVEERLLTWLERASFYINCHSGRVYEHDKCTYHCGNSFTDVTDRYEVRIKEEDKECASTGNKS